MWLCKRELIYIDLLSNSFIFSLSGYISKNMKQYNLSEWYTPFIEETTISVYIYIDNYLKTINVTNDKWPQVNTFEI